MRHSASTTEKKEGRERRRMGGRKWREEERGKRRDPSSTTKKKEGRDRRRKEGTEGMENWVGGEGGKDRNDIQP